MRAAIPLIFLALAQASQHHGAMYHFPQWSPDGRSILVSATNGDSEIYLLYLDGRPPRQLTYNTANDDGARWVSQGRILFQTDRRGAWETFLMEADGSNPRPVPASDHPSVNAVGDVKLVEDQRSGGGVIVAQYRDGTRRDLSHGPHAEQPSFSPDGRFLVYEQRSPDAPADVIRSNVVVALADGTGARVVSAGTDPSWSPDGLSLLFKFWVAESKELWVATVNADGSGFRRLAPGVHPAWSPDGARIVFMSDFQGGTHIWIMDRAAGNKRCLTCR